MRDTGGARSGLGGEERASLPASTPQVSFWAKPKKPCAHARVGWPGGIAPEPLFPRAIVCTSLGSGLLVGDDVVFGHQKPTPLLRSSTNPERDLALGADFVMSSFEFDASECHHLQRSGLLVGDDVVSATRSQHPAAIKHTSGGRRRRGRWQQRGRDVEGFVMSSFEFDDSECRRLHRSGLSATTTERRDVEAGHQADVDADDSETEPGCENIPSTNCS